MSFIISNNKSLALNSWALIVPKGELVFAEISLYDSSSKYLSFTKFWYFSGSLFTNFLIYFIFSFFIVIWVGFRFESFISISIFFPPSSLNVECILVVDNFFFLMKSIVLLVAIRNNHVEKVNSFLNPV